MIPLNFFTPNYIEHSYSHLVENLYSHKTKTLDALPVNVVDQPNQSQKFQVVRLEH